MARIDTTTGLRMPGINPRAAYRPRITVVEDR